MADVNVSIITAHGGHRVVVAADDRVFETPPLEHLAFYAGLGVLVCVGLVDWPMGLALGVGHVLIGVTNRPGLNALGEALGEV